MPPIRIVKIGVLSFLLVLVGCGNLLAQRPNESQPIGRVEGSIQDRFGQCIQEATVVFQAKVDGKKLKRKTKSNRDGTFDISLPAGVYEISIDYVGFRRFRRKDLLIETAKTQSLNVILEIDPKKSVVVNE